MIAGSKLTDCSFQNDLYIPYGTNEIMLDLKLSPRCLGWELTDGIDTDTVGLTAWRCGGTLRSDGPIVMSPSTTDHTLPSFLPYNDRWTATTAITKINT